MILFPSRRVRASELVSVAQRSARGLQPDPQELPGQVAGEQLTARQKPPPPSALAPPATAEGVA